MLTIGMATYDDFDALYFTIQSLRMFHDLSDVELIVVDNFGCDMTKTLVETKIRARYIRATDVQGTSAPRDLIFREATGEYVLCIDSHVLLWPGAVERLKQFYADNPDTNDLYHGPILYDSLEVSSTHFSMEWGDHMFGWWQLDDRGRQLDAEPFEIQNMGMGIFSCRREAWPGFNPLFKGFGGEEGYTQEKFRQRGGKAVCLPFLRWLHKFDRPKGVPYRLTFNDKFRNHIIGFDELGWDVESVVEHFGKSAPRERLVKLANEALAEAGSNRRLEVGDLEPAAASAETPSPDSESTTISVPTERPSVVAPPPRISCLSYCNLNLQTDKHILEASIKSFLAQDAPSKELIILNDVAGRVITVDAPGVRVVNIPNRVATVEAAGRIFLSLSEAEYLVHWWPMMEGAPTLLSTLSDAIGETPLAALTSSHLSEDDANNNDTPFVGMFRRDLFAEFVSQRPRAELLDAPIGIELPAQEFVRFQATNHDARLVAADKGRYHLDVTG